ncbi:hypothetical protein B0H14DRAFT_2862595 [Mycena olivaceomarginata]|nr:hypothetical protein B0H14DRAFT_2862595 [Mycena olivaceomarginata]
MHLFLCHPSITSPALLLLLSASSMLSLSFMHFFYLSSAVHHTSICPLKSMIPYCFPSHRASHAPAAAPRPIPHGRYTSCRRRMLIHRLRGAVAWSVGLACYAFPVPQSRVRGYVLRRTALEVLPSLEGHFRGLANPAGFRGRRHQCARFSHRTASKVASSSRGHSRDSVSALVYVIWTFLHLSLARTHCGSVSASTAPRFVSDSLHRETIVEFGLVMYFVGFSQ